MTDRKQNEKPFALRDGWGGSEWYCYVAGKMLGPWPDKGSALAGYETELRRAKEAAE